MSEWYHDFVDTSHTPKADELLCLFRLEPAEGFGMEDAAGRVASESSVGTWTELTTMRQGIRRLMAKAYEIHGNFVKVAYPLPLFEKGNMAQVLSSIGQHLRHEGRAERAPRGYQMAKKPAKVVSWTPTRDRRH